MAEEEEDTDYGLSSELDLIFTEVKGDKKRVDGDAEANDTIPSMTFLSQNDFLNQEKITKSSLTEKATEGSANEKLVKWAARLELESLSLKELIAGNLGDIFDHNYDFLAGTCNKIMGKLDTMETSIKLTQKESPTKKQDSWEKELGHLINALHNKIELLEKQVCDRLVDTGSRKKRTIEDTIADKTLRAILGSEALKGLKRQGERTNKELRDLKSAVTDLANTQSGAMPGIQNPDKEICILKDQVDSTSSSSTASRDIAAIKEFLQLLIPRIITLETKYRDLSTAYCNLVDFIVTSRSLQDLKSYKRKAEEERQQENSNIYFAHSKRTKQESS